MNIHAMNPKKISQECSERHVQSVIEGLMERLMEAEALADEILTLNTKVPEIGHGKLLNLHQKASELKSMIGDCDAN